MAAMFSSLLRRTHRFSLLSSSLAPTKRQHIPIFVSYSSLVSSSSPPQNPPKPSLFVTPLRFFASSSAKKVGADDNLKRVLESEIHCAEESDEPHLASVLPDGFPFEIVDNPGEQTITLKREFAGESIQVEVHMPDHAGGEDEKDDDDDDRDEDKEDSGQLNVSLIVTVAKGKGPCLEFCVTAYPDEITIDSLQMKGQPVSDDQIAYEGPEFSDLDENLQKAFYKYLEDRGIKSSLTNFLQEYMVKKDSREYLDWLKNMKNFIEK